MTKKYFHHNIAAIHDTDPAIWELMSEAWDVEDVITAKMTEYELPSSVFCLMRSRNQETLKVKEYVYQRRHAADKKLKALLSSDTPLEITLITNECYVVLKNTNATPYDF